MHRLLSCTRRRNKLKMPLLSSEAIVDPLIAPQAVRALEQAEVQYRTIAASGGWSTIPGGPSFRPGDGDPRTTVLSQRLATSMDLLPQGRGEIGRTNFNEVIAALQRFQSRHGLRPTGIADPQTIEALNVTAESRLVQLRANIARMRDLSQSVAPSARYVLVNIPAFQLEAVEEGQVALRHRVIVGRTERPTPGVKAQVRSINFYPSWHVPDSVARLDLIPHLQKDPEYLQREHIRLLADWRGNEIPSHQIDWRSPAAAAFKFRQDPGPWNALGLIRLDMPNAHAVYMHDTPMKDLFDQRQRAMSAGCVRVENVAKLATWVMREVPGWGHARVEDTLTNAQPANVILSKPVPVLFVYVTAWSNSDGTVEFRSDLYGQDGTNELVANDSTAAPRYGPGGGPIMTSLIWRTATARISQQGARRTDPRYH